MKIVLNIILSLYIFGIINVGETQDSKILYEESVTKQQAIEALSEIQPQDALPLILFKSSDDTFQKPYSLEKIVVRDGKMVHGTEFNPKKQSEQIFFCPKENSDKKICFMRQHFEKNQPLKCDLQSAPSVAKLFPAENCGDIDHYLYASKYDICDSEKYPSIPTTFSLYKICYDTKMQKTLHAGHIIYSTKLLNAKLLLRERSINYDMRDDFVLSDNEILLPVHSTQIEVKSNIQLDTNKAGYKIQKLVPSEDMAFALWRKTTFQRSNIAMQHEKLFDIWNEINGNIRYIATRQRAEVYALIQTGVFDVESAKQNNIADDQLPNIWVKMIHLVQKHENKLILTHGIAILMNNFIDVKKEDNDKSEDLRAKAIETYCQEDLCVDSLKNKLKNIGGRILCCPVTSQIAGLFQDNHVEVEVLRIPNITEYHETLHEHNVTDEDAVQLIGKIQSEEILPIVLLFDSENFTLRIPIDIDKIETKNTRIMNGSKFLADGNQLYNMQIFFCPKENSNEVCLQPSGSILDQLKCTSEPIPVVRKLPDDENKCGSNDDSILYEVIYELCPNELFYSIKEIQFYKFCYDTIRQKNLFTQHSIMSPKLLFSKLLFRERAVEFPMAVNDELPIWNLQELKEAWEAVSIDIPENTEEISTTNTKESSYKLQKFVPSEDMAFASWKKTTFQYVNAELQHEMLIPLWNDIKSYIRNDAYASYIDQMKKTNNYVGYTIYTGVFDMISTSASEDEADNDPKSKMWVNVIYNETSEYQEGVVILMNNFLIAENNQFTFRPKDSKRTKLEENCINSLCVEALEHEFEKIGGWIRCCALTVEIGQLFGIKNITTSTKLLKIPHINV